ncbi:hypothetical protein Syun_006998 [Stephania yunnanensis]|uniref:Uncharacterized protein n=1 Tax=Stephania yunnanensis TaxID=152371 RepID=A0AAP0KXU0_9MAGN
MVICVMLLTKEVRSYASYQYERSYSKQSNHKENCIRYARRSAMVQSIGNEKSIIQRGKP